MSITPFNLFTIQSHDAHITPLSPDAGGMTAFFSDFLYHAEQNVNLSFRSDAEDKKMLEESQVSASASVQPFDFSPFFMGSNAHILEHSDSSVLDPSVLKLQEEALFEIHLNELNVEDINRIVEDESLHLEAALKPLSVQTQEEPIPPALINKPALEILFEEQGSTWSLSDTALQTPRLNTALTRRVTERLAQAPLSSSESILKSGDQEWVAASSPIESESEFQPISGVISDAISLQDFDRISGNAGELQKDVMRLHRSDAAIMETRLESQKAFSFVEGKFEKQSMAFQNDEGSKNGKVDAFGTIEDAFDTSILTHDKPALDEVDRSLLSTHPAVDGSDVNVYQTPALQSTPGLNPVPQIKNHSVVDAQHDDQNRADALLHESKQIEFSKENNALNQANLKIYQEELGEIVAKIEISNQKTSLNLIAESLSVRNLLETHMQSLKDNFLNAELTLVETHVQHHFSEGKKQQGQDAEMMNKNDLQKMKGVRAKKTVNSASLLDTYI